MSRDADRLHPAVLMFIGHRYAETRIIDAVRAAGYPITLAQARICARIGPDGTRLTALAEQAQMTKQSAGALVDQLEREAYVERVPDPADARARLVRIAKRGLAVQQVARREEAAVLGEWTRHLGPDQMEQLMAALEALRPLVDPYLERGEQ